jgi:hypothetical protein
MHNRRFGAFLMGAWLLGSVLIWFVGSQSILTVDRILSTPPQQVQKEFEDMGNDVARQILRFEANQLNRRVTETFEVLQLGLAGALLASSILTSSRSKTTIIGSILLMGIAAIMAFYLTPSMNALARAYDFLPATAAQREREAFQRLDVWHRVLQVLGIGIALIVTARLLFDFYEFGAKLIPDFGKNSKRRRRRRRSSPTAPAVAADSTVHNEAQSNG